MGLDAKADFSIPTSLTSYLIEAIPDPEFLYWTEVINRLLADSNEGRP